MLSASVAFNWSSCFSPCPPPYSVLNTAAGMILFSHKSDSVTSVPQTPQGLRLTQGKSQSPPRGPRGTPSISSLVSSPALLTPPHTHAGLLAGTSDLPGVLALEASPLRGSKSNLSPSQSLLNATHQSI